MKMHSVMSHKFSQVPHAEIQRSQFNRSHGLKTTFDAGRLVPVFVDEALPGDTFNLQMTTFARLSTPIKPVMDNLFLESFFFAVPYRLVWDNWQKFNGEQVNPDDSTDYVIPQWTSPATTGWQIGFLADHFGLPTGVPNLSVSSLPLRAYQLIWNEWFRDQNLQDSKVIQKGDQSTSGEVELYRRGKRHDYFTSCLPWPQKGPAVEIPLGTSAPVMGSAATPPTFFAGTVPTSTNIYSTPADTVVVGAGAGASANAVMRWNDPALYADLSAATAATINSLRQAFQIQRLYERDARGGTRYTEIIRAHFGVTSPDARLQRPEYLGGGSSSIGFTTVPQSSGTPGTGNYTPTPQANLSAYATASGRHGFVKSFTEHCIVIGMVSVRADLNYQQGINRMWSRSTRFDFYWPALSHIGEQAVLNKEIYAQGTAEDLEVFGYQERFAEYRYKPSLVTGKFRSSDPQSLDIWHLAQDFVALPVLNESFIVDNPPIERIVAVPTEPHFLFDSYFDLKCARPMPVYGVPGMIDHF